MDSHRLTPAWLMSALWLVSHSYLPAAPPTLLSISPTGAQRGTQVTLVVEGAGLESTQELYSSLSSRMDLVTSDQALRPTASRAVFRFEIATAEALGPRVLRVRTLDGISNPLLFSVSALPEVSEHEPNDATGIANRISQPAVLSGHLTAADRDLFQFHARAGERLVFEADARRLGSSIDPTLHLYASGGREIALAEDTEGMDVDARLDHTFAVDGDYWIEIHDAIYAPRTPDFYRLRIGDFAYAGSIFPLGGRAGSDLVLSFEGGRLALPVLSRLRLPTNPIGGFVTVGLPPEQDSGGPFPFLVRLGELPETFEKESRTSQTIVPPVTLNGRLRAQGEVDTFGIECAPGEIWSLAVDAARIGSSLDALLTALKEDGSTIASADDDGIAPDPRLEFTVPAGVNRVLVEIRDIHGRGGDAFPYRLTAKRRTEDFTLQFGSLPREIPLQGTALVEVECLRQGYAGPVRLRAEPRIDGVEVRCGDIPAGQTKGYLTFTGAATGTFRALEISVTGVSITTEPTIERRAVGSVFLASEQGTPASPLVITHWVTAVASRPLLALHAESDSIEVPIGHSASFRLVVDHREGEATAAEIQIDAISLPAGVVAGEAKISARENVGSIELKAAPTASPGEGAGVVRARILTQGGPPSVFPLPLFRVRLVSASETPPSPASAAGSTSTGANRSPIAR